MTVQNSPATIAQEDVNNTAQTSFGLDISTNAQLGDVAQMSYTWTASPYSITKQFTLPIGEIYEDWEDNNPFNFDWQNEGSAPWYRDNTTYYEGSYSMRSGNISDNQTSTLFLTIDVISPDTLSFYYKVSSEQNYDFLNFYVVCCVDGE
jgi:hypothetical protein